MFRIRRVFDAGLPADAAVVARAQELLRSRFQLLSDEEIDKLPELLADPAKAGFKTVLFVAEERHQPTGFAILLLFARPAFAYLDFLFTDPERAGRGVGAALYQRLRDEAALRGMDGLYFECLPDEENLCPEPDLLPDNIARLRFYERFGARPLMGTGYETPLPGSSCPPYLVFDPLDGPTRVAGKRMRAVTKAILTHKYAGTCPPEYTRQVLASIPDKPIELRPPRYVRRPTPKPVAEDLPDDHRILVVANPGHSIHHVRERGYVEAPVRVRKILDALRPTGLFSEVNLTRHPERSLHTVHDADFLAYLKRICAKVGEGKPVYPYVFPIRNAARPPKELAVRAGYYCIDTFTPLSGPAYEAARRAADCGLTAAEALLAGRRLAYALVRPPGHHAETRAFGGFCYFNTAALAAHRLSAQGRVALLDVDYHHGNGTQEIFYERADVLTLSIHGHPSFAYPYFSGFADETGRGPGEGFNCNYPLAEQLDGPGHRKTLVKAVARMVEHAPWAVVISLGLDTAKGDPTGTWSLAPLDFEAMGRILGELRLPTLVVQEGGYRTRTLGVNARAFFIGLWKGANSLPPGPPRYGRLSRSRPAG